MTVAPVVTQTVYNLVGTNVGPFDTVWPYATHDEVAVYYVQGDTLFPLLVEGPDYTLTGATPLVSGGHVTLNAALPGAAWPANSRLALVRASEMGQPAALGEAIGFRPSAYEAALDYLERQIQDLRSAQAAALGVPPGALNFNAGAKRLTAVADAVDPTDAATLAQLNAFVASVTAAFMGGFLPPVLTVADDDAAAAAAGVHVGGLYRTGSVLQIRVA